MRLTFLLCLVAANLSAQERVFPLANPLTPQSVQEVATILRTVLQLKDVNLEPGPSIRLGGPGTDFGASEWLLRRLDQPVNWRPSPQELNSPATRDYQGSLRMYYLPAGTSVQSTQETLTILRAVLEVRKVFNYTQQSALVVADTSSRLDAIEWLLSALAANKTSEARPLGPDIVAPDNFVQVFALPHATASEVQNLIPELRGTFRLLRVFARTSPTLVVARGSEAALRAAADRIATFK